MLHGKKVLAIIPARSGSKGIPDKNIKVLAGKPLMGYTIEAALGSRYIDEVMVSTDSREYAESAKSFGAHVPFLRPEELSTDTSKTIDVVTHVLEAYQEQGTLFDIVTVLQPTSPFRTSDDIDGAMEFFVEREMRGLVSISRCEMSPLLIRIDHNGDLERLVDEGSTVRRQDMRTYYYVNGAIYINAVAQISRETSLNDNPVGFVISDDHALDIDEPIDFLVAQQLVKMQMKQSIQAMED